MAYPQYNHQWTPMYQYHSNTAWSHHVDHNAPVHWAGASNPPPPPYPSAQPSSTPSFSYKPTGSVQTLEVDDTTGPTDSKPTIPADRKQTVRQKYFGGLKRTLRLFTALAIIVLAVNVSWLGYAHSRYGIATEQDGYRYGTIQSGNCHAVKRMNTWLHLAINIMSTLLLTASNAFMAAYSGPTRHEIDQAHAKRTWLHIGSMSLRNMRGIAKRKSFVVLLLALSSTPFHLLYNSLVFTSLASNNYYWAVVTEGFLTGEAYNLTGPPQVFDLDTTVYEFLPNASLPNDSQVPGGSNAPDIEPLYEYFDGIQKEAQSWDRLDQKTCIQTYSNAFISDRRNVVLVSSAKNDSNAVLAYSDADMNFESIDQNRWICSQEAGNGENTCNTEQIAADASSWQVSGYPIEYCLSQRVQDFCSVKFNLDIMIVVIAFNTIKVVAMLWILLRLDAELILTSVGDAVVSFMRYPDLTTLGMCLANKRNIDNFWRTPGIPRLYEASAYRRWGQAISRKRWIMFFLMMAFAFCTVFFFGLWGFIHVRDGGIPLSFKSLWGLGFGTISQYTMVIVGGGPNPITMSLIANLPQVILALIYLVYQGIITAMFGAADWARFAFAPQTLMVSTPVGKQRGTWLLGAPFKYGFGLLVIQTLLHWFVSQSIFVIQLTIYDKLGNPDFSSPSYSNCGYSPIAIIFAVVTSGLLCVVAIVFKMRSLPVGAPPIVSTCSAAVSAACHVPIPLQMEALEFQKLRWGATDHAVNGIGHCSLGPAESWDTGRATHAMHGYGYAGSAEK